MGHQFLRHVERTKALVYVLDTSPTSEEPASQVLTSLRRELDLYCPGLSSRPSLIFLSKTDLGVDNRQGYNEEEVVREMADGALVLRGSAMEGTGLETLAIELRHILLPA